MKNTIKSKAEIERIFHAGHRYSSRSIVIIALQSEERGHCGRVAFIAGKKLGNAPKRNYAKRVLRQIENEISNDSLKGRGIDLVFMAKKGIFEEDYKAVKKECSRLLERLLRDISSKE